MPQYCGCSTPDCSVCFSMSVPFCPTEINIPASLTPLSQYYFWVEDKFGHLYYNLVTSDASGNIVVIVENFPSETFSAGNGPVVSFLTIDDNPGIPIVLNFSDPTNCILITTESPVFLTDECSNYLTDEDGNYLLTS